ncbi:hypothetical protein [Pseudoduganella umbonata]|uniref:Uncharacterized protein n=1 Tax=Pseudoduganella umbonata TaxID=864828 RepID=A0A4P8I057_9BURK|nr:hypothetical protein [Pseudoduganella umbonata]MBB3223998.1 hypothetical protein [Pseudoduganella umbonata]QCP14125.1 hypothetical protein FCL38_29700 [Pseudoduganella umbonata]
MIVEAEISLLFDHGNTAGCHTRHADISSLKKHLAPLVAAHYVVAPRTLGAMASGESITLDWAAGTAYLPGAAGLQLLAVVVLPAILRRLRRSNPERMPAIVSALRGLMIDHVPVGIGTGFTGSIQLLQSNDELEDWFTLLPSTFPAAQPSSCSYPRAS